MLSETFCSPAAAYFIEAGDATGMNKYIIRRLLQAIPTLFGITIIVYAIMLLAPGNPVTILAFDPTIRQDERERLARSLGVNDPFYLQYLRWLIGDDWMRVDSNYDGRIDERDSWGDNYGILRGDFGASFKFRGSNPLHLIGERLGATIELNLAVLLFGLTNGILIGVLAAVYRGRAFDRFTRVFAVIGDSVPAFWLGLLAIVTFGIILPRFLQDYGIGQGRPLLPMGGRCPPIRGGCPPIFERLHFMLLPTLVSSFGLIAVWSRLVRASMLETISSDFIQTARSKGLTNRQVWFRHALRNAIIPFAVFLAPTFLGLIGGSVIIERVFTWPGVGLLTFDALVSRDHPMIMASVLIGSVLGLMSWILSDILLALFDPRVRFS
ncbi:MAG: ABC transporter permease [Chloroflexota bacterium]|nr:ABC transporter permease [Chloroflexota bacterium]